jgi:hypothetical protein
VRLFAAASALSEALETRGVLTKEEERALESLRHGLDASRFEALWSAGGALSWREAITLALAPGKT